MWAHSRPTVQLLCVSTRNKCFSLVCCTPIIWHGHSFKAPWHFTSPYSHTHTTMTFGVLRDFYESNPNGLPTEQPHGTFDLVDLDDISGICDSTLTHFGMVNFKSTNNVEFSSYLPENTITEFNSNNCARKCFLKAGCTAFSTFRNVQLSTRMIGPS